MSDIVERANIAMRETTWSYGNPVIPGINTLLPELIAEVERLRLLVTAANTD